MESLCLQADSDDDPDLGEPDDGDYVYDAAEALREQQAKEAADEEARKASSMTITLTGVKGPNVVVGEAASVTVPQFSSLAAVKSAIQKKFGKTGELLTLRWPADQVGYRRGKYRSSKVSAKHLRDGITIRCEYRTRGAVPRVSQPYAVGGFGGLLGMMMMMHPSVVGYGYDDDEDDDSDDDMGAGYYGLPF